MEQREFKVRKVHRDHKEYKDLLGFKEYKDLKEQRVLKDHKGLQEQDLQQLQIQIYLSKLEYWEKMGQMVHMLHQI